jgi:RNA polymerase sigma-70 factor (ECF subfamily)
MDNQVLEEQELLELARQYDHSALAHIYDTYSPGLYRYSIRLLSSQDLAEECVSETFSRFLQALQKRRGPSTHLQAYLYRTAHNWIIDQYRRTPLQPVELNEDHEDQNANPEADAVKNILKEHVRRALQKLTPDQQQVIALKYLEGWDNQEIGECLGKPVGAVKSLQHRALAALQKVLKLEEFA